jgi:RND superfamily putative drug exporter
MRRLAIWSVRHRRLVLAAWAVSLIAVSAASMAVGSRFSNNLSLPGTGSTHAVDLLKTRFPAAAGDADQIVFRARRGTLTDPVARAAITAGLGRIARLPHVVAVAGPYARAGAVGSIAGDGGIGYATVTFDRQAGDLPTAAISRVVDTATAIDSPRLQVELGGQAIEQTEKPSLGSATAIGLLAAIVVLLVSFGSFLAMGLPIVTAVFGLGTGLGVVAFASHGIDMAFFVPQLAAMIGLGVGIDYALFIVTRYRDAYRTNGGDVGAAVETAMDTAGRAVLFAGMTVVIALLGMFALGVSFLASIGIAGSLAVVLVLAASATLLPVLLTFAGHRLGTARRRRPRDAGPPARWLGFIAAIQRHPWPTALAATALMLALASPLTSMRLGLSDAGDDPAGTTTHRAFHLLARGFGPGFNGPLQIAAELPRPGATGGVARLAAAARRTPDVASVGAPTLNRARTAAVLTIVPASAPQAAATSALVRRLRSHVIPPIAAASGTTFYVGGWSATTIDFAHVLATKLWLFVGIVILLSALLLLVVFRSLVIPIQAAVMNLLSIGASMGIATALFQRGWLSGVFHVQRGPIDAYIPVIVFAIVFGLSMDYQVFLVSRIHEEWQLTGESSAAVRTGLVRSGRVVTAAAAVMIVVFLSFVGGHDRRLELLGVSLASAVFLDAIVIRMILLPAVLEIAGRSAWTFPGWLDRRLPRVAIEAELSPSRLP